MQFSHSLEQLAARTESRLFIDPNDINILRLKIRECGFERLNYDNLIVQTVYFATQKLEVPKDGYIRARRYVSNQALDTLKLASDEPWIIETKLSNGSKQRVDSDIREMMQFMGNPVGREDFRNIFPSAYSLVESMKEQFSPIAATEWLREHFVNSTVDARVTLDTQMKYFGFVWGELVGHVMGNTFYPKLEWKGENFDHENFSCMVNGLIYQSVPEKWQEIEMRKMYSQFINPHSIR